MATFTSAKALAAHQQNRAAKAKRSLLIGSAEVAAEMKQEAIRLTSGGVSSEQLRREGHPFGRSFTGTRRQRGTRARLPINAQTHRLQRSLRVFRRLTTQGVSWQLQFTAPYAQYILAPGGTKTMVARGFWAAIRKHYHAKAKRALLRAWRNAQR